MKTKDLRELSKEELFKKLIDTREEFMQQSLKGASGQLESLRGHRHARRQIARIQTLLKEKTSS